MIIHGCGAAAGSISSPSPEYDQMDHQRVTIVVKTLYPNLSDGYVWRKYGQKIIKGEEHPRYV
jgi:hypothetical protein